jgi:hypothetical protein
MFVGHYCAAFGAKRIAPAVPLPVWFISCQVIDLFWGGFVLLGVERMRVVPDFTASNELDLYYMPYTHSLSSALIWSLAGAMLFWLATPSLPQRTRTAVVAGMTVASHWALDLLVHIPDLPLWYDSFKVGFGWWNYRTFAFALELVLMWGSLWLCLQGAPQKRRPYLFLGCALSALQVYSTLRQPPHAFAVASELLASYLAVTVIAWWADRATVRADMAPAA